MGAIIFVGRETDAAETRVAASPETVWETLLDPAKLAAVIPGCHALEPVGDNAFRAEVSLGVGPVGAASWPTSRCPT